MDLEFEVDELPPNRTPAGPRWVETNDAVVSRMNRWAAEVLDEMFQESETVFRFGDPVFAHPSHDPWCPSSSLGRLVATAAAMDWVDIILRRVNAAAGKRPAGEGSMDLDSVDQPTLRDARHAWAIVWKRCRRCGVDR